MTLTLTQAAAYLGLHPETLRQQRKADPRWVFPSPKGGLLYKASNRQWYRAVKAAGLPGFRWHDLRHTWASWHVQAGTPLHVLRELGGWKTMSMVQRYAHLAPEHLAQYADNATMYRQPGRRMVAATMKG